MKRKIFNHNLVAKSVNEFISFLIVRIMFTLFSLNWISNHNTKSYNMKNPTTYYLIMTILYHLIPKYRNKIEW